MINRRFAVAIVAAAAAVLTTGGAATASDGARTIPMNPEQETGDVVSDGSGFFSYSIDGDQLCYTVEVRRLTVAPSAAHIHKAPRDVAGGVVVPLLTPPAATSTVSDCITAAEGGALTPAELAGIAADPRAHYVNVHTSNYPGGEIRGQLK